jgi:hypothetical protein
MRLHCAHEIGMGAEAFWSIIHAPEYEAAVAEAVGLREYREIERREEDDAVYRRIRVVPELSPQLRALLGRITRDPAGAYIEEQWRSKRECSVRWKTTPPFLPDRVRIEGVVRVEPIDEWRCLRVLEGEVRIRVLGLGALAERAVVSQTVETYGKTARVAERFAPDRPEVASGG